MQQQHYENNNQRQKTSIGNDMKKMEHLQIISGNVNLWNHYRKQYGKDSKKLKIEIPCDPTIPLLGTHARELKSVFLIYICTVTFISKLFTVTKFLTYF